MDLLLDGKKLAEVMQAEVAENVARRLAAGKRAPGLATVLIGENPASQVYVRNKRRSCAKVGMLSFHHDLPADASQQMLLELVATLNADPAVHGILVQLPLPAGFDEAKVIRSI